MAKAKSLFVCQQCGYETSKWMGKCPNCGEWNSFVETLVSPGAQKRGNGQTNQLEVANLQEIAKQKIARFSTKIEEFDQILGGGVVLGQVILISGNPGIGKSTLLLQVADSFKKVLYVSGEESVNQIAIRAQRLRIKNKEIGILEATDIDAIIDLAQKDKPEIVIIDSIQVMATSDLSGMAGSVGQVRECAFRLVRFAKTNRIPVFIVGHVTKEGTMAGPSVLAHIVDTVLDFSGDKDLAFRLVRATKNRFGPTDNIGVFAMKDTGLVSVTAPEKVFLTTKKDTIGSVKSAILTGNRPVFVEIESLVLPTKLAFPRRIAQGVDSKRLEVIIAVLIKHSGLPLYGTDVFVNVSGGISAKNPSVDLAICLSIASSYFNRKISSKILAVGEVGLLGEIREVVGEEKIAKLATKIGYKKLETEGKVLQQVIHNFFPQEKMPKIRINSY